MHVPASPLAVTPHAEVIILDVGFGPTETIRVKQGTRLLGYFTDPAAITAAGIDLDTLEIR